MIPSPYFEQNKNQSGLTDIDRPFYIGSQITNDQGYHIPSHWHYHMEIIYFASGKASITNGNHIYEAEEGEFIIIHPCEVHSVTVDKNQHSHHYVIGFDPELLSPMPKLAFQLRHFSPYSASFSGLVKIIKPEQQDKSYIHGLIEEMATEYRSKLLGFELAIAAAVLKLTLWLLRHQKVFFTDSESTSFEDTSRMEAFSQLLVYLNDNCHKNITADEAARMSMMSYSRFASFFKKLMHTSFIQYTLLLKIRRAEQLLLDPAKSITQIALESGFNHSSYFIKQFKNQKGMSPHQYRKEMLQQVN
ncbi:AraC family transcriptional regulator [Paenibacillus psychroresistens]|uniref:AraC family transcriptional regulator n=1 Tax=Paenibacillus psychroresistens TaxID=1778678 RepID=A0A6B8RSA7_9BACL|nr:AraC family transcriptional regulator [Paenibacillus psychroresistens]QGQ98425.1 AraC family transcriptional regulator [Paenibacillus psychroresistens]